MRPVLARAAVALATICLVAFGSVVTANPAGAAATVTTFSPSTGRTGTVITIKGTGFLGTRQVEINGSPLELVKVAAGTIKARTYSYTTKGPLTIYAADWSTITTTGVFTPEDVTPVVRDFSPTSGPPGTLITINGTGFARLRQAQINSIPLKLEYVSPTQVKARTYSYTTSGPIEMNGADWAVGTSSGIFTAVPTGSANITNYGATHTPSTVTFKATFIKSHTHHQVFIDADATKTTGYTTDGLRVGAEFLIENGTFYRWTGPYWAWTAIGSANHTVAGSARTWTINRADLATAIFDAAFRGVGDNPTDTSAAFRYALS